MIISFNLTFSWFLHIVTNGRTSFFRAKLYSIVCILHLFFICSSVHGHPVFSQLDNRELCCIEHGGGAQISLQDPDFSSFGYISRSKITGLFGSSILNLSTLHSGYIHYSTFLPIIFKSFSFSIPLPKLIFLFLNNSHLKSYKVISDVSLYSLSF